MSALASSAASNPPSKAPAAAVQPLAPAPNGVASTASILPSDKPIDAPEHCPGTESVDAGKASSCEGCANQDACLSAPKGPDPDLPEVARRMASIKHKILVLSGKGGVGKVSFRVFDCRANLDRRDLAVRMSASRAHTARAPSRRLWPGRWRRTRRSRCVSCPL